MAVKHKPPNDLGIGERNNQLGDAGLSAHQRRNTEDVSQAVEMRGNAVHFGYEKSDLVDMEVVILRVLVNDGPFFRVAELDGHIGSIFVKT